MTELVSTRREGRVLVVSMRREEKRNAVNRALADAIDGALNSLDDNNELWAGVLTGTATVFSAGSDLTAAGDYYTDRGGEYGIVRRQRKKPLIAAVEGAALGGGLEIVLACDLVVASTAARFGLPEVSIGVIPTCAALFRAPRSFPLNLARELILTGQSIDATRAYSAGFVNVLAEPGEAVHRAVDLASQICSNAPLSVQACLTVVNSLTGRDDALGWEETSKAFASLQGSKDTEEGIRSFLEKRPPIWTGQ
jgi:enoyl-CoA hydratase/carnithine racemase